MTNQSFLSENFQFLEVKFSIYYLNRCVFKMLYCSNGVFMIYLENQLF